jgi:hypothetical protein
MIKNISDQNRILAKEDHDSIPHNCDRGRGGWNHLMTELTSKPDKTGGENKKKYRILDVCCG